MFASFDLVPNPANRIAPIGHQTVFQCQAGLGYRFSKWDITVIGSREFSTNQASHVNGLRSLEVIFSTSGERYSNLTMNATVSLNGSLIVCEVESSVNILLANRSSVVKTLFYGEFIMLYIIFCSLPFVPSSS